MVKFESVISIHWEHERQNHVGRRLPVAENPIGCVQKMATQELPVRRVSRQNASK